MSAASREILEIGGQQFPPFDYAPKYQGGHNDVAFIEAIKNPTVEAYIRACAQLKGYIEQAIEKGQFTWRFTFRNCAFRAHISRLEERADTESRSRRTEVFQFIIQEVEPTELQETPVFYASISSALLEKNADDAAFIFGRGNRQNLSLKLVAKIIDGAPTDTPVEIRKKKTRFHATSKMLPILPEGKMSVPSANIIKLFEDDTQQPEIVDVALAGGSFPSEPVLPTLALNIVARGVEGALGLKIEKNVIYAFLSIVWISREWLDNHYGRELIYPYAEEGTAAGGELKRGPADDLPPNPGEKGKPEKEVDAYSGLTARGTERINRKDKSVKLVRLQADIPDHLKDEFEAKVAALGMTKARALEEAVKCFIEHHPDELKP